MSILRPVPRRRIQHPADVRAAWLAAGMGIGCAVTLLVFWIIQ